MFNSNKNRAELCWDCANALYDIEVDYPCYSPLKGSISCKNYMEEDDDVDFKIVEIEVLES